MIARATVVAITPNQSFTSRAGKSFSYTELVYKNDKGLKSQRVLDQSPFSKLVKELSAGAQIDITLEKEGDYWQMKNIALPSAEVPSAVPASSVVDTSAPAHKTGMVNEEIRRSVALKASVDMRISDETEDNILRRARVFEDYLAGKYDFDTVAKIEEHFTNSENFVDNVTE